MDCSRDQDAASRRFRLQACGDVYAVAEQIVLLDDQIAQMQSHTEQDDVVLGLAAALLDHRPLELDRRGRSLGSAGEFHQHTIAGQLDDSSAASCHHGHKVLPTDGPEAANGTALVPAAHKTRVANHVGSQDRRKSSLVTSQWISYPCYDQIVKGPWLGNDTGRVQPVDFGFLKGKAVISRDQPEVSI